MSETIADKEKPEVQVEDDRPLNDRVPERNPDAPSTAVNIPTDDEIERYDASVKARVSKLKYEYNEERRAREALERQNAEAVNLLKTLREENKRVKGFARERDKEAFTGAQSVLEAEFAVAKKSFEEGFITGDTAKASEANAKMMRLAAQIERVKAVGPVSDRFLTEDDQGGQTQPQPQAEPDHIKKDREKAARWSRENTWFGSHKLATSLAYGVHAEWVEKNPVAVGSDDYYKDINSRVRKHFPEVGGATEPEEQAVTHQASSSPSVSQAGRNAAPGQRRTIKITTSQAALAKKLGLTNEQYAAELMKLEKDS